MKLAFYILLNILVLVVCQLRKREKTQAPIKTCKPSNKFGNPSNIRDRIERYYKPMYPDSWGLQKRRPFSSKWMDYCDPYHCGDYHKPACGLNRFKNRFQWFQSGCHLVMNNACSTYRGFLKYDQVDNKYCRAFALFSLRSGCPTSCPSSGPPVCAVNLADNMANVFKNICYLYKRNCLGVLQDYVEVDMNVCLTDVNLAARALEEMNEEERLNPKNIEEDEEDSEEDRSTSQIEKKKHDVARFLNDDTNV